MKTKTINKISKILDNISKKKKIIREKYIVNFTDTYSIVEEKSIEDLNNLTFEIYLMGCIETIDTLKKENDILKVEDV